MWWLVLSVIGCGFQESEHTVSGVVYVCEEDSGELSATLRGGGAAVGCSEYVSWHCDVDLVDDQLVLDAEAVIRTYGRNCRDADIVSPVVCEVPSGVDPETTTVVLGGLGRDILLKDVDLCVPE